MSRVDRERFRGFALLYNESRPAPPQKIVDVILSYLELARAEVVVDLGSGTGLSTSLWVDHADTVLGIEPTDDMRTLAHALFPAISFVDADCYNTGLASGSVDIVTCSQSFHWMEPKEAIEEVHRILKPNGVFAVYDCLWPVSYSWEAERAHQQLYRAVEEIVHRYPELASAPQGYPKEKHQANLEGSQKFRYVRELVFDSIEDCSPNRFADITMSQGYLQALMKKNVAEIAAPIQRFLSICARQTATQMRVGYRMILGKK